MMEEKDWKGMKLKLGFWIGDEKSVSEGTLPPIVDITWQSPYILAFTFFQIYIYIIYKWKKELHTKIFVS